MAYPETVQTRPPLETTSTRLARNSPIGALVCDQVERVTASASVDKERDLYVVDTTSGSVTMTLPAIATVPLGKAFTFYKPVAANSMIVDGYDSEQIEGAANETRTAQYAVVTVRKVQTGASTYAWMLAKADLTAGSLAPNSVGTTEIADNAITNAKMADDSVDTAEIVDDAVATAKILDANVTAAKLATAAVVGAALGGGTRANTVDTAVVLDAADAGTVVTVSSTAGAGTRTITRGTLPVGAMVMIVMTAFDTNAYTAAVQGGTVTFNAVGEAGLFFYDGTALRFIATGDVPATFA